MKDYLIFAILMFLIKNRHTTAKDIAQNFEISPRSVYRYIDALSLLGMPIITKLGNGGGVELIGDVCLENLLLSKIEKQSLFEFMQRADLPENIKNILKKLI
mgnify:CR=1 FL=1